MTTHIVFILDRSGSMGGLENDVIGGYNSFLNEQKKLKGEAKMTTILFDDQYEVLINGIDLQDVPEITSKEYYVRGWTALLDAVGKTINTVKAKKKKKDKIIFLINTDGHENSSTEFTKNKIKELVERLEKKEGWKFVFFGAGIDAFAEGSALGINTTITFAHSDRGISSSYATASYNIANMRQGSTTNEDEWETKSDWSKDALKQ